MNAAPGIEGALARALLNDVDNRCCPNPTGFSSVAKVAAVAGGLIMIAGIILAVIPSMPAVAAHVLVGVGTPLFALGLTAVVVQSDCLQGDTKWKVALVASLILLGGGIALISATTGAPTIPGRVLIALGSWGLFASLVGGCVRSCMPADHPANPAIQNNQNNPFAPQQQPLVLANHLQGRALDPDEQLLRDAVQFLQRTTPMVGNLFARLMQEEFAQPEQMPGNFRPIDVPAGRIQAIEEQEPPAPAQRAPQPPLTPEQRATRAQRLHAAGVVGAEQGQSTQEQQARRAQLQALENASRNRFLNEMTVDERAAFCTGSWDIDWSRREASTGELTQALFQEHNTQEAAIYAGWFNHQAERPFVAWFQQNRPNRLYLLCQNTQGIAEVWSYSRNMPHQHTVLPYSEIQAVSLSQQVRETGQLPIRENR